MESFCTNYIPNHTRKLLFDLNDKPDWFDDLIQKDLVTWCRCLSHKLKNIATGNKMVFFFESLKSRYKIEETEVPLFQDAIEFVKNMKANMELMQDKLMLKLSCKDTGIIFIYFILWTNLKF